MAVAVIAIGAAVIAPRFPRTAARSSTSEFPAIPNPVGLVNDFANVIQPPCRERIDRVATEVREKSKGEIVVVTLGSLQGERIEEWGRRIGRSWGVGFAGAKDDPRTNTGVIAIAQAEEGFDGAEAFISDSLAGRILDEQMLPSARRGDVGLGVLRTVNAVAEEFARRFDFQLVTAASECAS